MGFIGDIFSSSKGAGYEAQGAPFAQGNLDQQNQFLNALYNQNTFGGLGNLQDMLMKQAQGQGPNPAQAMLNQATAQNSAQQAALMGSQRGVAQNPALLARSAADQGAKIQQQAAGQAATLGAEQQLAAQRALQNQLLSQQGIQGNMLSDINAQRINMQSNINNANAGVAQQNARTQGGILGGLFSSIPLVGKVMGGGMAEGGEVPSPSGESFFTQFHKSLSQGFESEGGEVSGKAKVKGDSLSNDTVPAMLSPKEIVLPRSVTLSKDAPDKAKAFVEAILAKHQLRGKK